MSGDITSYKIGVVGAGSWGTALANLLATKGYPVDLWVYEAFVRDEILNHRENRTFLPGVTTTPDLSNCLAATA